MTPDSPESRIGRLEIAHATLSQRVEDMAGDLKDLSPLHTATARMEEHISSLRVEVRGVVTNVEGLKTSMESREDEARKERRGTRIAAYTLAGTIVTAIGGIVVGLH